jgi:hypothetical protein
VVALSSNSSTCQPGWATEVAKACLDGEEERARRLATKRDAVLVYPATKAAHLVRPAPAVAPWSVWVGLALLMTGLAGAGTLHLPLRKTGGAACRASSTSSSSPTTPSSP